MEGIVVSDSITLLPDHQVGVFMQTEPPVVAPRSPKPETDKTDVAEVASWGDQNDFPQQIITLAEKSTELPALLDWKARALQGREVKAFQPVYDSVEKKWVDQEINDLEIKEFLNHRTFKRYMREAANDFFWFWNVFPELIKNVAGDKIVYLGTQDASFCRWGKMNDKGLIKNCYVSSNWPIAKIEDKSTIEFKVIDPYSFNAVDDLRESKTNQVIYPISYPSPGKSYYQLSAWDGFRTSGWADIAAEIPKFKKAIMQFQVTIKYMICIPLNYWPARYPDWENLNEDEKNDLRKAKLNEINSTLAGTANAGKSIMVDVGVDREGRELPGWKIIPIEDKLKEGAYLEDSQEASQHLMRALAVDPTLVGNGPGRGKDAGSGSDKRIAFNIYVALQQPYRDVILEPLYFIAEYNGWQKKYPGINFKFEELQLETLDKSHTTAKPVTN